jgi:hypothetical protein
MAYLDLITPTEATTYNKSLAAVSPADARLVLLTSIAAAQIQRWLRVVYTADQITALTDEIKYACALYIGYLWALDSTPQGGGSGDFASESLGDYSYTRGSADSRGTLLGRITALLLPYQNNGPTVIPSADWTQPKSHL